MRRYGPRGLKWTPAMAARAWRLREEGLSPAAIAGRLGLAETTVRRHLETMAARRARIAAEREAASGSAADGTPHDVPERVPPERIAVRVVAGMPVSLARIACIDGEG